MQFRNISGTTIQVVQHLVPDQGVIDVDVTDADYADELQILIAAGEFEFVIQNGQTPPASLTRNKRVWSEQILGGRSYNYYSTSIDRGWNTVYGPNHIYWSSGYSKTNPTPAAHGISVTMAAKLKRITHRFRSSTSASTPVNVKLWKQKKIDDSNTVVNTKLLETVVTTDSTRNRVIVWESDFFGDPTIQVDEVVFLTWSRDTSGSNTWWYYENLTFEFEEA